MNPVNRTISLSEAPEAGLESPKTFPLPDWYRSRIFAITACLYLVSSFVHFPSQPNDWFPQPHLRIGPLVLAPPRVLSGDSPHYLAAVNSLIEDRDFDLSNNYRQASQDGLELGGRFRGRRIDHHAETDSAGREIGTHSPFLPLLLSLLVWPLKGTAWVEPACILLTLGVSLAGLRLFADLPAVQELRDPRLAFSLLAFATPVWCYSRDLWTAPWTLAIWLALLWVRHPLPLGLLSLVGTTIKYPFFVVPLFLGIMRIRSRRFSEAAALLLGSLLGLAATIALIQYLFRDVDHFSWFHSGIHAGFDLPFDGALGLLFHADSGLLLFFPFLLWGIPRFRRLDEFYLPALVFFLVHASYQDWVGGAGFSSRYLVPMLPMMTVATFQSEPAGRTFRLAVYWSVFWGLMGGFFPALVYDRTPWGFFHHVFEEAQRVLAGG